tara:strand:+ start:6424 stop:7032 length:609 start_codon:yes stop_codon:yes gene_type:complete
MTDKKKYVLYVALDKKNKERSSNFCLGSRLCLDIIETSNLKESVKVENLDTIIANQSLSKTKRSSLLPQWLDGSPTLVDVKEKTIMYGSSARDALAEAAKRAAKEESYDYSAPPRSTDGEIDFPPADRATSDVADSSSAQGGRAAARMNAAYDATAPEGGKLNWTPDKEGMKEKKASKSQMSSIQSELERRLKLLETDETKK